MKKLYILLLSLISLHFFAQKDYSRYYNSWRLGLNIGGAWQTADYRSRAGIAGGFTLEKGFAENATNFFSFAVRGRYLAANTYGMDYNRNYDVKGNDAYNGVYDPKVNFFDSVPAGRRYVYDNYKTTLYEGSLELQVSFNRLREQTHVILNLWGGVGITSYRAKSDLLDGNGKQYDFSKVDSTGNRSKALNSYNSLIDKKYESFAYGSRSGNLVTFSPSAGIGLGYQFSPGFSLLLEYKVTFPQGTNADLLDGRIGRNNDVIAGSNDYYHYTGINFLFTLRGKKKTTTPKEETVYTNTVTPVEPAVPVTPVAPVQPVTPTTPVTPGHTVVPVTEPAPVISYINPQVSGQTVSTQQYKIAAQILNVSNAAQIQVRFNGTAYTNFLFNPQTRTLEFNTSLTLGNNNIQIVASNSGGTDNRSSSVIYELPKATGNPPTLTITNPVACPATSTVKNLNLVATVTNVNSKNDITVKVNNVIASNFPFNASLGKIAVPVNLIEGNNSVEITAANAFGTAAKTCYINYSPPKQPEPLPVVSYINPVQPGFTSPSQTYTVTAQVLNVSGQNAISVYYNGLSTPFTYNSASKQVSFTAVLNTGSNSISITANNASGEDTKVTNVVYQKTRNTNATGLPPAVNLINPATASNSTGNSSYNFKLGILNVSSKNDISVMMNGAALTLFSYDPVSKEIDFSSNLIVGNNNLVVKASNTYGTDSKNIQMNYQPVQVVKTPPMVTIIKPQGLLASTSVPNYGFKATITNVPNNSGLVVKLNGAVVSGYSYDGFNLDYNAVLVQGNNTFEVSATNADGTDSKSAVLNFRTKVMASMPPVVNLINPSSQINTTSNPLYNFKLSVLNVASSSDIEVLFNGASTTNFTFSPQSKEVSFQTNLSVGNNTLVVTARNTYGTDSKNIQVNYQPVQVVKNPPVVTITKPQSSPVAAGDANYEFKATVTNIPNNSGLVVKLNGTVVSGYSYDGFNLTYNAVLVQGNNTFVVGALNADGMDSKSVVVGFRPKAVSLPPVVGLINPPSQINATDNLLYNFKLSVLNVASSSDIEVLFNGASTANFAFNTVSKEVDFQTNLLVGNNTLEVKGTNASGSDSKLINVTYTPHAQIKMPPLITFVNPASSASVQHPDYNFTATIGNMPATGGLVVTYNGNAITNYVYDGATLTYAATLVQGVNNLQISATNSDGTDTKSASVNYLQKIVQVRPPQLTILQPTGTPTVNTASYEFKFGTSFVTQSQLEVVLNDSAVTTFTFASAQGSFTSTLSPGNNVLSVKATTPGGSVTKTETVYYVSQDTTAGSGGSGTQSGGSNKITICHHPTNSNGAYQTLTIPQAAWSAHQAHGDTMGACPAAESIQVTPRQLQPIEHKAGEQQDTLNAKPTNITPRRPR